MNRKNYLKMLPLFEAWAEGKNIGVASDDRLTIESNICPTSCDDSSPFERWVINDEYVEFRLAIMRGEVIQYKISSNVGADKWDAIYNPDPNRSFISGVDTYRIKPSIYTSWIIDGAYCRHNNSAFRITVKGDNVSIPLLHRYDFTKEKFAQLYEKWEPEYGDIVYLWNDDNFPVVSKYLGYQELEEKHCCTCSEEKYEFVKPYIGDKFWLTKKGDSDE